MYTKKSFVLKIINSVSGSTYQGNRVQITMPKRKNNFHNQIKQAVSFDLNTF